MVNQFNIKMDYKYVVISDNDAVFHSSAAIVYNDVFI